MNIQIIICSFYVAPFCRGNLICLPTFSTASSIFSYHTAVPVGAVLPQATPWHCQGVAHRFPNHYRDPTQREREKAQCPFFISFFYELKWLDSCYIQKAHSTRVEKWTCPLQPALQETLLQYGQEKDTSALNKDLLMENNKS